MAERNFFAFLATRFRSGRLISRRSQVVNRPPKSPPNSDIDGVDEDARRSTEAAIESGQDPGDLARARDGAAGRPDEQDGRNRDDRSR